MITWNRRQVPGLVVAIAAAFLLVVLSACVDLTGQEAIGSEPASPIPTPTLTTTATAVPAATAEGAPDEPEATSQPEGDATPGTTDDGEEAEIIVSRTPIPTPFQAG